MTIAKILVIANILFTSVTFYRMIFFVIFWLACAKEMKKIRLPVLHMTASKSFYSQISGKLSCSQISGKIILSPDLRVNHFASRF